MRRDGSAGPDPIADLGAAGLGGPELDDELDVGMLSGGIAAGGHGLDLAQERPDHVDHPGKCLAGQVLPGGPAGAS